MKKLALFLVVLFVVTTSFATWMPLEDYSGVKHVYYKINYTEYGEQKEMVYGIEIKQDQDRYILDYNTTVYLPGDQEITSEVMYTQQFSMMMYTFLNPMLSFIYEAIDLDDQATTKLFGFGTLKYEGQVTVQGKNTTYTGTKVALYNEDKELSMYWILNPNIPFAIETFMGEGNSSEGTTSVQLWDYAMR